MSKSLRAISLVSAITMVSRVLGLARDSTTAAVFGTSALASAFYTAYTLPNLFRRLLGEGALTAAFVPALNEELETRQREGAFRLVSQVASWLFVATTAVVILSIGAITVAAYLARHGYHGNAEPATVQRWLDAARLAVWLFPYLVFVCLAAAFSAALQMLQRFLEPALSPIWLNCAIIGLLGGAVLLRPQDDAWIHMRWLCAGVLLGGFLQMIVPAITLMRLGWRPRMDLQVSPQVKAIARLMTPTLFGSAIYLVNIAVSRFIGLSLDDASATILNLGTRLMELPIGVFAVAVTTVVFPLISRYAAQGDWTNMATAYRKGMRLILVINIPAAAGLALLAEPIVRLLFERGAFHQTDTARMMPVVALYGLGLPFFSFVNLTLRAFYAQKDTVTPVHAAFFSFVINLILSLALMREFGTLGLAFAGNFAIVAQAFYLQYQLSRRRSQLAFAPLIWDLVKITVATVVMSAAVWGLQHLFAESLGTRIIDDAVRLALIIGSGIVVYGAALWILKIEGRAELTAMLTRARAKDQK